MRKFQEYYLLNSIYSTNINLEYYLLNGIYNININLKSLNNIYSPNVNLKLIKIFKFLIKILLV